MALWGCRSASDSVDASALRRALRPCTLLAMSDDSDAVIDALFASDLAKDVRSEFNARRDEGMSVHDATGAVVAQFRHLLERPEEGPVLIIAIAALQQLERAPTATFRDAALDLLREGHGFASRPGESICRTSAESPATG